MSQTIFKSTEGIIPMDYAATYREKHIKGMLDRRIMGDRQMTSEESEGETEENGGAVKPDLEEGGEGEEPQPPVKPGEGEAPQQICATEPASRRQKYTDVK